ncbi:L,D-transpeptidase [Streptomyces vinaceus]|uniref:L,D-transpeptidase n=1 Tax=Streptomyces vinaceus TaxID=1960 RepID=UPI0036BEC97B
MRTEIGVVAAAAAALVASVVALPAVARAESGTAPLHGSVLVAAPAQSAGAPAATAQVADVTTAGALQAQVSPTDGSTVGVGMPVSVTFDRPVTNERAVAAAIQVSSSSGQPVVGHWFGPTRLDFRPQHYWKAGSDITVRLRTADVTAGPGLTDPQDETVRFKVGRSQVSTVDVRTKTMTVVRDGKDIATFPVSAGAPSTPTHDGQMVISQKLRQTRMNGASVGFTSPDGKPSYDIPDVPHALRLSSSGTFLHGNYWAANSVFGQQNTSHGCIGLRDVRGGWDATTPAAWFYDHSLVGDVVVVEHSGGRTIDPANGLGDWNLPWQSWIRGSTP